MNKILTAKQLYIQVILKVAYNPIKIANLTRENKSQSNNHFLEADL